MSLWTIIAIVAAVVVIWMLLSPKRRGGQAGGSAAPSSLIGEVKAGVAAKQAFEENWPDNASYEQGVSMELFRQGADAGILKEVLGDRLPAEIERARKAGEEPVHFTHRWLYSITAPRRWDFIHGLMGYYLEVVHFLMENGHAPTKAIESKGGKEAFLSVIESSFTRGVAPHLLVSRHFPKNP